MSFLIPTEDLETYAEGLDHAEGIAYAPDGNLYAGGEAGQLYRIGPDRQVHELLTTGGFMLGIAADGDSRLYACDSVHRCVWRIDPATGERSVFADGNAQRKMAVPNWGCFAADGTYYVSDSGAWKAAEGVIWRVPPGGEPEVWTEECRDFPNGMAVSADGGSLLVLESTPGRLVEVPIGPDGAAGPREVLCELPGTVPDGVAVATDGSLVIACYRPDVIYRWHPEQGLQELAGDLEGTAIAAPTNVVFVGEGLDTMVVPNLGRWHLTAFRHAGLAGVPLHYPTKEQLGA
jgi:gluconolactonase